MDEFDSDSGIVVIAVSIDILDPAIKRAGRFHRQFDSSIQT